jgi:sialate O-acetylesterase
MVVQQNKPVKIWGWADAGEMVSVSFHGQEKTIKADANGKWGIFLSSMKHGGPFNMTVKGNNILTIKNILIGEVWLCSGQSNMEWPMSQVNNSEEEISNASHNEIRFFIVPKSAELKPAEDISEGEWKVVTPSSIASFSAVGYFFGKHLHQRYKYPMGLIGSYWGGTDIETWMSHEAISSVGGFEKHLDDLSKVDHEKIKYDADLRRKELQSLLKSETDGIIDGKALWADPAMEDGDWEKIYAPKLWEEGPLPNVDGVVWYRKTIELTKDQIRETAVLYLGMIDDSDKSWVNGHLVGQTEQKYNLLRKYEIPVSYLKEGKNVITIRVEDTGGGGGIWGEENLLKIETSSGVLSLAGEWKYKLSPVGFKVDNALLNPNMYPTLLFNGMIYPISNYTIQGAIWYQGENNAGRAKTYRTLFPSMINNWRKQFNNPDLAFLYVQLANFMEAKEEPEESAWAELREAQNQALSFNKVGAAVIIDIGDAQDIHPRNKKDVGYRLALPACKLVHGDDIVYSGPVYKSMTVEGGKVKLSFDHVGGGLKTSSENDSVIGFQVSGKNKKFYWAKAWIEGDKVVLYSDQVKKPTVARYAWSDNPEKANLYNKEGLPASPFRTDDWPGITQ